MISVTYLINAGCNERCLFCFNHWRENGLMDTLPHDKKEYIVKKICDMRPEHLAFSGGEPLIDKHFVALLQYTRQQMPNLILSVQTNATLLTEDITKKMKAAGVAYILISLHGQENEHNALTGAKLYTKTIMGIKNAIAAHIPVVINTVVTSQNIAALPPFLKDVGSLGVSAVQLSALYAAGSVISRKYLFPSPGQQKELVSAVTTMILPYTLSFHAFDREIVAPYSTDSCGAGEQEIAVFPNGDVTLCPAWEQSYGNLLQDDWTVIIKRIEQGLVVESERKTACNDCGGCLLSKKAAVA